MEAEKRQGALRLLRRIVEAEAGNREDNLNRAKLQARTDKSIYLSDYEEDVQNAQDCLALVAELEGR